MEFELIHYYAHSPIYCYGDLLHTVQMAGLNEDSKTFVDMKLKALPNITLSNFYTWMETVNNTPTTEQVRAFVDANFDPISSEFEYWFPDDFKEHPRLLDEIDDVDYRNFASALNNLWQVLGRKMTEDVRVSVHISKFVIRLCCIFIYIYIYIAEPRTVLDHLR